MTEPSATTEPAGPARTSDGTLVDQSPTTPPTPATTTPSPGTEGLTLLNQNEAPPPKPAAAEPPKDAPKPAATTAPEAYADYKVPDGFTLDPAVKGEADKIFKGLGLSQEAAQSLVDFYTAKTSEAFQQPFKAYQDMTTTWRKEAEEHPDLKGKLGPGQEVNLRIARALDSIGDAKLASDFRGLMDLTGAGNNQAFIRVIDKLASRAVEGTHVSGNGPTKAGQAEPGRDTPPTAAAAMYPHLPSRGG